MTSHVTAQRRSGSASDQAGKGDRVAVGKAAVATSVPCRSYSAALTTDVPISIPRSNCVTRASLPNSRKLWRYNADQPPSTGKITPLI
jgi:hypothetical protein